MTGGRGSGFGVRGSGGVRSAHPSGVSSSTRDPGPGFRVPLNDWQPTAPLANLRLRAQLLAGTRQFFAVRGILEVETPALSQAAATDTHLQSFSVQAPGGWRYLHTSPELHMKRLLAGGSGDIYQICKVFRAGETSARHNPEFTMVEWYRLGFDHLQLMAEVEAIVHVLLPEMPPMSERLTYREAFERCAGIDPFEADARVLLGVVKRAGIAVDAQGLKRADLLDLVAGAIVYPQLGHAGLCVVYDYPANQAILARVRDEQPPVAERFEVFYQGLELANGFHELTDAREQRRRFEADLAERRARALPRAPADGRFLAALEHGLPECAGVALGFDRLAMLAADAGSLAEVIAFPAQRA